MKKFSALILAVVVCAETGQAQTLGQGTERIAVDDGIRQTCVNGMEDEISIRLDRIVVQKTKSWFSEDTSVDIVIDGKIEKIDDSFSRSKAEMPLRFTADLRDYKSGTVVTPVDISLLSKYPLSFQNHKTNLLEVDFHFINRSEDSPLTKIISILPDAARGLPLPPTPYTDVFIQSTQVLGNVVDAFLDDDSNKDDVSREGRITLEFNDTGMCGRNGAYDGTYAFVKEYQGRGDNSQGIVKLDELQSYCFIKFPDSSPIYIEKRDEATGTCTYDKRVAIRLVNPHFTVLVSITNTVGAARRDVIESSMAAANAEKSNEPIDLGFFDDYELEKAADVAGLLELDKAFASTAFELLEGQLMYNPNKEFLPVAIGPDMSEAAASSSVVSREDLILSSLARCTARGIDAALCF